MKISHRGWMAFPKHGFMLAKYKWQGRGSQEEGKVFVKARGLKIKKTFK
jgi:hypothetical protein